MNVFFKILFFSCLIELTLLFVKPKWATLGRDLPDKKKSIKKLTIVTIVLLLLSIVTSNTNSTIQKQTDTTANKIEEVSNQEEIKNDNSKKEDSKPKDENRFSVTSEPNTSAAVDELILRGKNDSKNATKDDIKEAVKFINDSYNKYWIDNETMQKTMYYGALLQYSNENKNIKELGLDSEQVVKYIYRKAEKVEDESTQANLTQIKKSLNKISDDYKK